MAVRNYTRRDDASPTKFIVWLIDLTEKVNENYECIIGRENFCSIFRTKRWVTFPLRRGNCVIFS